MSVLAIVSKVAVSARCNKCCTTWGEIPRPSQRSPLATAHYSRREVTTHIPVAIAGACGALSAAGPAWARGGQQDVSAGMQRFKAGDVAGSIAFFDRALEANPALKPYLWQRGLALYYAGEYEKAAEQFRQDVAVNPNDTEEAIWAFLAESQFLGPEKARQQLLQVGRDPRVVLEVVYDAIKSGNLPEYLTSSAKEDFYLALYRGLYLEAQGDKERSAQEIEKAVKSRYSQKGSDYMIAVASVHCSSRSVCSNDAVSV